MKNIINSLILSFVLVFTTGPSYSQLYSNKPILVEISTQWCYACNLLKPTLHELQGQYLGQIDFVYLDATSEETVNASRNLAAQYGISEYFDTNRNVFPKVGILCPGSKIPQKVIIGANPKEVYTEAIDNIIQNASTICTLEGRPGLADQGSDRPEEVNLPVGRPNYPNISDRPLEFAGSGRPGELSFWTTGQRIPNRAYFQYLILPKCTDDTIICTNAKLGEPNVIEAPPPPANHPIKPKFPKPNQNKKGLKLK